MSWKYEPANSAGTHLVILGARILWLYHPIEEAEGSEVAREMCDAANVERAAVSA